MSLRQLAKVSRTRSSVQATWPVASWASLDHGGGWKLLHHGARHFFAPVTVVAVPGGDTVVFRGVNDTREVVEIKLRPIYNVYLYENTTKNLH